MKRYSINLTTLLSVLGLPAIILALAGCAGVARGSENMQQVPNSGVGFMPNTISVNGTGTAEGAPDIAFITLGVSTLNADVGKAITENNTKMNKVRQALLDAQIDEKDLQTTGFNVWPEDKYNPQTGEQTGERVYHVDNMLNVKVRDLANTGDIINDALNAGANSVNGLSFTVEDTKALEAEARTKAVADAKTRAQQLADELGMKLGPAIYITENGGYFPPPPIPMDGMGGARAADAAAPPPISPGQQTVTNNVQIVFSINP